VETDGPQITLWLYDDVTEESATDLAKAIAGLPPGRSVLLRINSHGGSAFQMSAILTAMREYPGEITTRIDGVAASAAAIIALLGKRVQIGRDAWLFVHRSWGGVIGNAKVMRDTAAFLDKIDETLARVIQERTGADSQQVEKWLDGEIDGTIFTAQEAFDNKLVDVILPEQDHQSGDAQDHGPPRAQTRSRGPQCYVPPDPPGGSGEAVEGRWERPRLSDFTDKSWEELDQNERRAIARHFGFAVSLDTYGDLKLPHHFPPNHPQARKPSLAGVRAALARVGRTQGLSDEDRRRVRRHLRAHLPQSSDRQDAGRAGEHRNMEVADLAALILQNV